VCVCVCCANATANSGVKWIIHMHSAASCFSRYTGTFFTPAKPANCHTLPYPQPASTSNPFPHNCHYQAFHKQIKSLSYSHLLDSKFSQQGPDSVKKDRNLQKFGYTYSVHLRDFPLPESGHLHKKVFEIF